MPPTTANADAVACRLDGRPCRHSRICRFPNVVILGISIAVSEPVVGTVFPRTQGDSLTLNSGTSEFGTDGLPTRWTDREFCGPLSNQQFSGIQALVSVTSFTEMHRIIWEHDELPMSLSTVESRMSRSTPQFLFHQDVPSSDPQRVRSLPTTKSASER